MNFFELHIGDYEKGTAHLTAVEDGIYGRLIRRYYDTEKPLPADVKAVQRLARARAKDEREAVETVLEEFFELQDDGWHHKRCDAEIAEYQAKQVDVDARRENEAERQRRHRARRKELFEALREHGLVPKYDTPTAELEAMLSRVTSHGQSQPVTRDATANQSPVPSNTATAKAVSSRAVVLGSARDDLPAGTDPASWAAFTAHHASNRGWSASREITALGQLRAAVARGVDPNALLERAVIRNLADLADVARHMAQEATDAARPRSGAGRESLTAESERLNRELDELERGGPRRLAHG